jgi:hypothetical protein
MWFFIGVLLNLYGNMIMFAGIIEWRTGNYPPGVELNNLHAPIWWGCLLAALGALCVLKYRPRRAK